LRLTLLPMKRAIVYLLVAALAGCKSKTEEQPATADINQPPDSLEYIADFKSPESVLYYVAGDDYFVSNINGGPGDHDDNGFISRISPTGAIENLKWIDGESPTVTLHAPKGMAILGDTLFVADIDSVRAFAIGNGAPLGARAVAGATFLNDLATGSNGVLYVTDTGLKADFTSSGTAAVYSFEKGEAVPFIKAKWLSDPNGIAVGPEGVLIVSRSSKTIFRMQPGTFIADSVASLPGAQLDGVERLADGNLLVSSWETKTVYHVDVTNGQAHPLFTNIESPADIGYDSKRKRVLIPQLAKNRVLSIKTKY
jgi:hypothetical protein